MRLGRALDTVGCSNRQGCVECMRVGRVLSACPWSTCSQAHQIHLHARVATPAPPAPSASSWSAQRGTPCSVETVQRCSYVGFGRQARWSRPRGGARSTSASSFSAVPTAGAPSRGVNNGTEQHKTHVYIYGSQRPLTTAISPRPVTKRRLYTHPDTLTLAVTLAGGSWVWRYPSALHSPSTHVKTTSLSHSSAVGLWKKKVARLTWSPPGRDGVGVRGRGRPRSPDSPGRHLVG